MSSLYAFSLGPIATGAGFGTIFVSIRDGQVMPSPPTNDPAVALRSFKASAPPGTALRCDPDLAGAGRDLGFVGAPMDREALAIRAQIALVIAHGEYAPSAIGEIFPLLTASAAFWTARPWERLPADVPISVTVKGAFTATYEAAVMGASGGEYGVLLYTKPGSVAKVVAAFNKGRPDLAARIDLLSLSFDGEPEFALRAIEAFCGLPMVPTTIMMRRGQPVATGAQEVLALAVTLYGMSLMKGEPGEVLTHVLSGGEQRLVVTVQLPGGPTEVPADAKPGARARPKSARAVRSKRT